MGIKSFLLLLFVHLFASSSFAGFDDFASDNCTDYARRVNASATPNKDDIDNCMRYCYASPVHASYQSMMHNYQLCSDKKEALNDFDDSECTDAYQALTTCKTNCKSEYDECVGLCKKNPDETERKKSVNRCQASYDEKADDDKKVRVARQNPVDPRTGKVQQPVSPITPAEKAKGAKSVEPELEKKSENKKTSDDVDAPVPSSPASGSANVVANNSLLQGLGSASFGNTSLPSSDPGAVDYSEGPDAGNAGSAYSSIASAGGGGASDGVSGAGDGLGAFQNEPMRAAELAAETKSGQAGGGRGAPPGGGMNPGSYGNMAPSNMAANKPPAPAKGGGGYYRQSPASEYLSKNSPFSYYAANGSAQPGKQTRKVAGGVKDRNRINYKKKENDGTQALHRLFGDGVSPVRFQGGHRGGYGSSGRTCLDTVFCSMESFFKKIEVSPNNDLNPTSY
ncbi:MAG: hypothetical protein H6623_04375 [Bdellovibrionaceae bacterium]|nr:hypothetical protein [Pseudobdellovibrionaceae bacterium]